MHDNVHNHVIMNIIVNPNIVQMEVPEIIDYFYIFPLQGERGKYGNMAMSQKIGGCLTFYDVLRLPGV